MENATKNLLLSILKYKRNMQRVNLININQFIMKFIFIFIIIITDVPYSIYNFSCYENHIDIRFSKTYLLIYFTCYMLIYLKIDFALSY